MHADVDVGYVVRDLEDIREYIELYYKPEDKKLVFETINYLLGHIKKYFKNNDLNIYKILRMLLLKCHWELFDIKSREHDCGENEEHGDDEYDVKYNENVINIENMNTIPENEQLCAYKEGMKRFLE